jgi:hypothetical protein
LHACKDYEQIRFREWLLPFSLKSIIFPSATQKHKY